MFWLECKRTLFIYKKTTEGTLMSSNLINFSFTDLAV